MSAKPRVPLSLRPAFPTLPGGVPVCKPSPPGRPIGKFGGLGKICRLSLIFRTPDDDPSHVSASRWHYRCAMVVWMACPHLFARFVVTAFMQSSRAGVSEAGKRSIRAAVLGCCLLLVCSGCRFVQRWREAEWRYRITRGPDPADCTGRMADARSEGCPTDGDGASKRTCESVEACRLRSCGCRLGWRPNYAGPGEAIPVAYYFHPRFHPVPLRPVFSPRFAEVPLAEPLGVPPHTPQPIITPGMVPPRIELIPPAPVPEEILRPQPEPRSEDRLTSVPRRLSTRAEARSWIFLPSAPLHQKLATGTEHPIRR